MNVSVQNEEAGSLFNPSFGFSDSVSRRETSRASFLVWIALIMLILSVVRSTGFVPTYQWKDSGEQITCEKCPPGSFVAKHCTLQSATQCQPCPDQHYTQYWNYLEECRYCNVFCEGQELVEHECTATHNRICKCQPGYYQVGPQICVKHKECRPGFGVSEKGTSETDTECVPCAPGTFSATSSAVLHCKPHQNCTKTGHLVSLPGTPYHDTLCTNCLDPDNIEKIHPDCHEEVLDFLVYKILQICQHKHSQIIRRESIKPKKMLNHKRLRACLTRSMDTMQEQRLLLRLLYILRQPRLKQTLRTLRHVD
ncbi:tumor necrosis factor receptor superfamily member 6B [Pelodytes ibericus]